MKDAGDKIIEKVTVAVVGLVYTKARTFDMSTHWATYRRQFEAIVCANHQTDKKKAVSLGLALKAPPVKLLQKVSPAARVRTPN